MEGIQSSCADGGVNGLVVEFKLKNSANLPVEQEIVSAF